MRSQTLFIALLASGSLAKPQQLDPRADSKIHWAACNQTIVNTTLASDCADFVVPLDYTTPNSTETIKLQIARIRATVQPSKGTILLNFGGPGETGREYLVTQASTLLALSGGEYDLAAFDPRGTVNTIPETCFSTGAKMQEFLRASRTWYDQNQTSLQDMWDRTTYDVESCYKANKKTQSFLGTGFVARDLISVVDALGEDGMLRYWGFSYGTVLGATVASIFPDRIDKLIIDGVQNPHEYYHAAADFEEWTDSDRVFSEIFQSCVRAGPEKCPMAAANLTSDELEKAAWELTEQVRLKPIPVNGTYPLDYPFMRGLFSQALYGPDFWPGVTTLLSMMATNQTHTPDFAQLYTALQSGFIASLEILPALYGIHCSDRTVRIKSFDDFVPVQKKLSNISKVMDGSSTDVSLKCAQWKSNAAGAYTGNFTVKTKNPILISANLYDGHTPIRSAREVRAGFEGSGFLEVKGFGHTTLAQPSVCNIKHTAAYWHNRTLPPEGLSCEVDGVPYGDYTWDNATTAAYGGQPNASTSSTPPKPSPSTGGASSLSYSLSALVIGLVSMLLI